MRTIKKLLQDDIQLVDEMITDSEQVPLTRTQLKITKWHMERALVAINRFEKLRNNLRNSAKQNQK